MEDELEAVATRIHADLRDIAAMFAEAERYAAAIRVLGFQQLITDEVDSTLRTREARLTAAQSSVSSPTVLGLQGELYEPIPPIAIYNAVT